MLKKKKNFLFDIDGTLAVDTTLYGGSRELIQYIASIHGHSFYITNNSTKSRKDYVEKFRKWNIQTDESQFITASYAACLYLQEHYPEKKIFVVGTASFVQELKEAGICVTEEVEPDVNCVLVGYDNTLTYEKTNRACELLHRENVDYLATNPDLCCPTWYGFMPDCGSICGMINASVKREPYYIGKPNKVIVEMCLKMIHGTRGETLVVGDRLYTDIACGINGGVETAVVYTGEATRDEVGRTEYKPDYEFETIFELYKSLTDNVEIAEGK